MKQFILVALALTFFAVFAQEKTKAVKKYTEEEVTFFNGDTKLVGTLTLPKTQVLHPAVILITGSGAQNRDEEILGFKIFAQIAHHLTENGIAVLRYDDRGVGGSTGNILETTTQETAKDAIAGIELLKKRSDIDPKKVGVFGHSEGGTAAIIVAANTNVAFTVLMAGSTTVGHELLIEQARLVMLSQGVPEDQMTASLKTQKIVLDGILQEKSAEKMVDLLQVLLLENLKKLPEEQKKQVGDLENYSKIMAQNVIAGSDNRWFRNFVAYDPAVDLINVKCPVLALFGNLDVQVPFESNSKNLVAALNAGGNNNYKIKVFDGANHLFQKAKTGAVSEYATLEKAFIPGFLEFISEWINVKLHEENK